MFTLKEQTHHKINDDEDEIDLVNIGVCFYCYSHGSIYLQRSLAQLPLFFFAVEESICFVGIACLKLRINITKGTICFGKFILIVVCDVDYKSVFSFFANLFVMLNQFFGLSPLLITSKLITYT